MPHVLIGQENQNASQPLASQFGHMPTGEKDAVICHIQHVQAEAGIPRVMTGLSAAVSFASQLQWQLHPLIVAQIWDRFGRAEVDLFASAESTHCPLFSSITDGIARLGVDALSYAWPKTLLYAFPPVDLIQPTLDRVCQEGLSLILVAPCWPAKTWYTSIVALLSGTPW